MPVYTLVLDSTTVAVTMTPQMSDISGLALEAFAAGGANPTAAALSGPNTLLLTFPGPLVVNDVLDVGGATGIEFVGGNDIAPGSYSLGAGANIDSVEVFAPGDTPFVLTVGFTRPVANWDNYPLASNFRAGGIPASYGGDNGDGTVSVTWEGETDLPGPLELLGPSGIEFTDGSVLPPGSWSIPLP